jgi:hypothetical protein
MPQNSPQFLYHYTNTAGAQDIRANGVVYPENHREYYGRGVLLSTLDPTQYFRDQIVGSIYGSGSGRDNGADELVIVHPQLLDPTRLRPIKQDLYLYSGHINVDHRMVIDKPRCVRAPPNGIYPAYNLQNQVYNPQNGNNNGINNLVYIGNLMLMIMMLLVKLAAVVIPVLGLIGMVVIGLATVMGVVVIVEETVTTIAVLAMVFGVIAINDILL